MKTASRIIAILIFSLLLSCALKKDMEAEIKADPISCELLDATAIANASYPFAGNWLWIKTSSPFQGVTTPETEKYTECWVIFADSIAVCRDGFIDFKIENQIHFDKHPFAGTAGNPDSSFLFFSNTGVLTLHGDTLEIYDSYVDGNDYWLVKK